MIKENNISFIILLIAVKCLLINSEIIFPVKIITEDNDIKNNESNLSHSNIIKKYFFNRLYAELEVGTPTQKILLLINSQKQDFKIINNNLNNNSKNNLSNNYFDETKSISYKTEGCKEEIGALEEIKIICKSNDTLHLYQDINLKEKKDYNNIFFQLIKDIEADNPGEIGLGLFDKNFDEEYNILKLFKKNNLINKYNWYFDFNTWNETKGKLILGALTHEIYKDKFSEKDFMYTSIIIESSNIKDWKIEFDKIYINQTSLFFKKAEFIFDSDIIIGTSELELELKDFFFNIFKVNENFFNDTFKPYENLYSAFRFYYFDINVKDILYKILPSIKFVSINFNYTFEITNDEMFVTEGNYIYFKIIFPIAKQQDHFILGKSFTLKYPFVFNPDLNQIGFYKGYNYKTNKDINYSNIIKIIIIIIASIILVIIGIKLGKFIYGVKRKKRANELNDDFDYFNNEKINE